MFYLFILGETLMEGLKHLKVHIHIGNVGERLPKVPARVRQEGPKGCRDTTLAVSIDEQNGALSVHQRPVDGEASMATYPGYKSFMIKVKKTLYELI